MSPEQIAAILVRLDMQSETMHELRKVQDEVLSQVRRTNGRVTALEQKQAVAEALEAHKATEKDDRLRWWQGPVAAAFCVVLGVALERLM